MTLVVKRDNDREYFYFQDNIPVNGKYEVVTTYIGRTDSPPDELSNLRIVAIVKHITKIFKLQKLITDNDLRFEYLPIDSEDKDVFELTKAIHDFTKKNLKPEELEDFETNFFVSYVHGTTAIEGNTLSEGETYNLLIHDASPRNKEPNEINEVYNFKILREYLKHYEGDIVDEKLIKRIHKELMAGVRDRRGKLIDGGKYRTTEVSIVGLAAAPSRVDRIKDDMTGLLEYYRSGLERKIHPLELASVFHQRFELIHPFIDGNGRTGRVILNFMLTRNGYPPIYITKEQRSEYLTALQEGDYKNYVPFILFIMKRMDATMKYLFSKTSMFKIIESNEVWQAITSLADEEMYKFVITPLKRLHGSKEIP